VPLGGGENFVRVYLNGYDPSPGAEFTAFWVVRDASYFEARRTLRRAIPDRGRDRRVPPHKLSDSVVVPGDFAQSHLEVSVDITHPWRGDLVVELVAPSGETVTLKDVGGGSADDWRATYTSESTPALENLGWGISKQGPWTMIVWDEFSDDVGTWNWWSLKLISTYDELEPPARIADFNQNPQSSPERD